MDKAIYLDYMATTPVDKMVAKLMVQYLDATGCFGNPASNTHAFGLTAKAAVENARQQVAELINAKTSEIVWTSGATESDNLAIKGAYRYYQNQAKHIITVATEHKAVLDTCTALEAEGAKVTLLQPDANGLISPEMLAAAMRDDTLLVSIMHLNNEMGVIQPIADLAKVVKTQGAFFHVDAAQSLGKLPIDVQAMQIDLLSMSAHKIYGPKGMGALYVRSQPRVRLKILMDGGGHESGLRSGTLATHQIVGMGEACRMAADLMAADHARISSFADQIEQTLLAIPGLIIHGDRDSRYPGVINFRVQGINGASLILAMHPMAVSATSACQASQQQPSFVLKALGLSDRDASDAVRLSIGRQTTTEEVDAICDYLPKVILPLVALSPQHDLVVTDLQQPVIAGQLNYPDVLLQYFFQVSHRGMLSGSAVQQYHAKDEQQGYEVLLTVDGRQAKFKAMGDPNVIACMAWFCEQLNASASSQPSFDAMQVAAAVGLDITKLYAASLVQYFARQLGINHE